MLFASLAFTAGVLLLQSLSRLPSIVWLALLPVCILLLVFWARLRFFLVFGIGFLWALGWAAWVASSTLPAMLEGQAPV